MLVPVAWFRSVIAQDYYTRIPLQPLQGEDRALHFYEDCFLFEVFRSDHLFVHCALYGVYTKTMTDDRQLSWIKIRSRKGKPRDVRLFINQSKTTHINIAILDSKPSVIGSALIKKKKSR